ncbi:MAG: Type II secretion system protein D [Verrucomicrobiae bacterium]|nr:Type II secretion system protein D [Verrucomicrobiae bacterium]
MRAIMQFLLVLVVLAWPVFADEPVPAETPAPTPPLPQATATPDEPVPPVTPTPFPVRRANPTRVTQPVNVTPAVANVAKTGATAGVIDFQGTPVQAVLEYYAQHLAKRSIIQAPSLPATPIYFRSQSDLTYDEARAALDSVFAINGIAVIPMGEKFLKVVQIQTAKQEGLPFIGEGKAQLAADALMTQVIQLKYAEPADVVSALQPYLHAYGQMLALPKSSCVLVTETAANVNQMLEIVKYIDVPSALKMETRVFTLTHAKSGDVVQRLQAIIQETQQLGARATAPGVATPTPGIPAPGIVRPTAAGSRTGATTTTPSAEDTMIEGKVIISADERTNKIFILSRPSNFAFFEQFIAELDAKVEPDVLMKVVPLQYATAEDAASSINALITGGTPTFTRRTTGSSTTAGARTTTTPPPPIATSAGGGASAADTGFLQFAQGVRILPDPRTNSLLVMATKEDMARIEELIRNVDTAVAQVQIEVIIAEVTLNNELDIGVNVFKRLFEEGQVTQLGSSRTTGVNPIQLPRADDPNSPLLDDLPTAASLAGSGGLTYFLSFQNLKLDAVIRALSKTSKGKVLSTPVIQTMDNQEANILVGESVPVPVSQVSSVVGNTGTLSTGSLNSNIEYKDAAIELTVTPRINPNGYVRMDIQQKVNDFGAPVQVNGTAVPTITKREAKSSVAVQDGSTIALGGLIKENKGVSETKVPFLGDIPFFGQLFKSKNTTKIRNELIIFIRPSVLRTDNEAVAEARRRSRLLKAGEDLELDKHFQDAPVSTEPQSRNSPGPVEGIISEDRQAAKVRALEELNNQPIEAQEN